MDEVWVKGLFKPRYWRYELLSSNSVEFLNRKIYVSLHDGQSGFRGY